VTVLARRNVQRVSEHLLVIGLQPVRFDRGAQPRRVTRTGGTARADEHVHRPGVAPHRVRLLAGHGQAGVVAPELAALRPAELSRRRHGAGGDAAAPNRVRSRLPDRLKSEKPVVSSEPYCRS